MPIPRAQEVPQRRDGFESLPRERESRAGCGKTENTHQPRRGECGPAGTCHHSQLGASSTGRGLRYHCWALSELDSGSMHFVYLAAQLALRTVDQPRRIVVAQAYTREKDVNGAKRSMRFMSHLSIEPSIRVRRSSRATNREEMMS